MASKQNTSSSSNSKSIKDQTLNGLGSIIKLLPTGTVFMFQFLSPVLSNNGYCHAVNKYLMGALLIVCAFNCTFATFTDSYTDEDGKVHYGVATWNGIWPSISGTTPPSSKGGGSSSVDFSKYKIKFGDFVHALFALFVFGVVAVLDSNTVKCYAPQWVSTQKTLLMVLPPVVGALSSMVFAAFPSTRHGIGYPSN